MVRQTGLFLVAFLFLSVLILGGQAPAQAQEATGAQVDAYRANLQARLDALNAPNNVQWSNPTGEINNQNFGRITSVLANSSRVVIANLRVNF